jgi:hypothetical protein
MDISYDLKDVPTANDKKLTHFQIDTSWTLIYSPWNPLEKGDYSMTYDITSEYNGKLWFNHWGL